MCPIKVIKGSLKGRLLFVPESLQVTRPALARVKKSLFDILMPLFLEREIDFLDGFAGTGQIGIEALSIGAKKVTFIEKDKCMAECIKTNLLKCQIMDKANLKAMDFLDFLETSREMFDIVFMGPPYPMNISNELIDLLGKSNILKDKGVAIIQHSKRENILDNSKYLVKYRTKIYGDTILDFFKSNK